MRFIFFLGSFLVFVLGLHAAQQTFVATPSSLAGWTPVGAELSGVLGQPDLTLPANAQLQRSCRADDIALLFATRPVIGVNTADWPVLELGDAALVLARSGAVGRLVLVLGEEAPQELPVSFALDAEGRSLEVLTLGFARSGHGVSVTASGQTLDFSASVHETGLPVEIVVSAGAAQSWSFQRLVVTVGSADLAAPKPTATVPSTPPVFKVGNSHASSLTPLGSRGTSSSAIPKSPPFAAAGGKASGSADVSSRNTLEIYTPPAVRQGRANAIRAAVRAKAQN